MIVLIKKHYYESQIARAITRAEALLALKQPAGNNSYFQIFEEIKTMYLKIYPEDIEFNLLASRYPNTQQVANLTQVKAPLLNVSPGVITSLVLVVFLGLPVAIGVFVGTIELFSRLVSHL